MVLSAKQGGVLSNNQRGDGDKSQKASNMISASKNLFKESEPPDYPSDSFSDSNFQADFQDYDSEKPLCSQVDSIDNQMSLKLLKPAKNQSQGFKTAKK